MSSRARWRAFWHGEPIDHLPDYEFGWWQDCYDVWQEQGLPSWVDCERKAEMYFGLERGETALVRRYQRRDYTLGVNCGSLLGWVHNWIIDVVSWKELMGRFIAPVLSALVVAIMAAAYAGFFFVVLDGTEIDNTIRYVVAGLVLLVIGGLTVAVVQRIRELRGGQEDDIGKY
jgi:hypothetical protein